MIDYEVVEGTWPLPTITVNVHEHYEGAYSPTANEIRIDRPDCTPEFLLLLLSHELVHWGHFSALREVEAAVWSDAISLDSDIFHRVRRSMELAACWFEGWPQNSLDHQLRDAEARRARRLVRHRDGQISWRHVPLLEPISAEEKIICERLGAIA